MNWFASLLIRIGQGNLAPVASLFARSLQFAPVSSFCFLETKAQLLLVQIYINSQMTVPLVAQLIVYTHNIEKICSFLE